MPDLGVAGASLGVRDALALGADVSDEAPWGSGLGESVARARDRPNALSLAPRGTFVLPLLRHAPGSAPSMRDCLVGIWGRDGLRVGGSLVRREEMVAVPTELVLVLALRAAAAQRIRNKLHATKFEFFLP